MDYSSSVEEECRADATLLAQTTLQVNAPLQEDATLEEDATLQSTALSYQSNHCRIKLFMTLENFFYYQPTCDQ